MGILGELWVKLGLKNDELNKGLNQSKQKVSGFAQYMSKLGGMMAAAFSVKEIIAFTHRTAELANKAKGVKAAFDKLGDPNLLSNLRKATAGTVDDLQLMQRAVQANNFRIPLDQLATYLNFATKRARETGQSVDYLVDSIITGLGRQSVMILDNLGISAAEIRENMKDGASMAEAVGKIIQQQMPSATAEIDKAAEASARLAAAWTNFQLAFGESAATTPIWNKLKDFGAILFEGVTQVLNAEGFSGRDRFSMLFGGLFKTDRYYENWAKLISQEREKEREALAQLPENFIGPLPQKKEVEIKKPLIQKLEEEIKAKEEIRNLSVNEAEIRVLNDEIAALQNKLKVLKMTNEELLKYKNEQRAKKYGTIESVDGVKTPHIWDAPSIFKEGGRSSDKMFQQDMDNWRKQNEEIAAIALEQQQKIQEGAEMMAQALNSGITAGLGELANLIAGVEGANPGQVIKALLSPLADAAISAGLLIMTTGEGIEALKSSLIGFFGGSAIAAGAALMAVGVAAKAGLAAIGKGGGSAGAYSNSSVTSYSGGYGVNTSNYAQANNAYTLTTTLKGQDLLLAIQRTENNNRR